MSKKILILGGLGNGSVIANAIVDANNRGDMTWEMAGYLNDRMAVGEKIEDFPVMGTINEIASFVAQDYYFLNTIFRIDGQQERIDLFEQLGVPDERMAVFVHPAAYIAPNVTLGPGTVVMPNVSISSGTEFGRGCLVMVGATVGHDNKIGKYCHIAAQSCVGAYLKIGEGVHIGLNATIRENVTIGRNATVGMGAVLLENVNEGEIWAGNPAKFLRKAK